MSKKDTLFFPHDYAPAPIEDEKMMGMIDKYGATGYGLYWRITELLHATPTHTLQLKPYVISAIAKSMNTTSDFLLQFMSDCTGEFELFLSDNDMIFCDRVNRNISYREEKTNKAKANAKARWDAVALQSQSKRNANKGKEIKGNKRKLKEIIPPTVEEARAYFLENGYTEAAAIKAHEYYRLADWHDSKGNKVKNWKQKMQAVWFKDENMISSAGNANSQSTLTPAEQALNRKGYGK